jgi:hypothetical protein
MKRFTVDFEAWTTLEAKNLDEAFAKAQGIINDILHQCKEAGIELEMVVTDDGIEEDED